MSLKERKNLVIQDICCGDWCFCRVELSEGDFAVGINERLLIYTSNTFQITNIERVLRAEITWMCRFYFTTSLVIMFLAFKGCYLLVC